MARLAPGLIFAFAALCGGCGHKRPPFIDDDLVVAKDAGSDASYFHVGPAGPPRPDAAGYCGNLIVPIIVDRPNLYFVLDASGSMALDLDTPNAEGRPGTKYDGAIAAIDDLLEVVGHRVSYGAAIFPDLTDPPVSVPGSTPPASVSNECYPGQEVFTTQPGDSVSYALSGKMGPTLSALHDTLVARSPRGGTPTAATLMVLQKNLLELSGKTYAFLLTDGAPNCDWGASCTATDCTTNIEGDCTPANANCCVPAPANLDCLDDDPTVEAVGTLAGGGVETFVIGMPGTSLYGDVLDRLAEAGGTARPTEPLYYPVQNASDLANTLRQIGLSVSIKCEVDLAMAPPDPALVNVYFDKTPVPLDAENGWTWLDSDDSSRILIEGKSCTLLEDGDVLDVQVVAGCPTVIE